MTEPTPTEAGATTTERRGRPRPQATVERDERVYQLLRAEGRLTREQIAEKLSITPSIAYMSLFRLKRDGYAQRVANVGEDAKSHAWEALDKS